MEFQAGDIPSHLSLQNTRVICGFYGNFPFFIYQYRVNIQIPHKIASISAIIPWAGQKPPPPYRTSPSAHCFSACPALHITAPATDAQRGQDHVDLGPFSPPGPSPKGLLSVVMFCRGIFLILDGYTKKIRGTPCECPPPPRSKLPDRTGYNGKRKSGLPQY